MKPKSLILPLIILAVLAGLVVWKQQNQKVETILEQTGLVRLMPEGISKSDVAKLELYAGEKPDEKLTLAYDADADKWRVASHFNAPVKKETIDEYLEAIVGLKGEPRTMGASDDNLATFEITGEKAFHVTGYKKDGAEPLFHLLVGKSPGFKSVFIRKDGSNDIFVEETDLRQKAGIYGTPPPMPGMPKQEEEKKEAQKPEPGTWLDKDIVKIDTAKVTKVALTMPDKALVFEKHEKPKAPEAAPAAPVPEAAPAVEAAPAPAGSSEAETPAISVTPADGMAPAAAPAAPEFEWVLASGGPGGAHKQSGFDSLLQKLSLLTATDIVDPSKKAEYGLETPAYVLVVTVEGQPEIRIEAGRPNPAEDGYVRVASGKEDIVYKVNKYTFEQIFPKGTELFDLAGLTVDKNTIDAVEINQPEGRVVLAKNGDSLSVVAPACDLTPQTATLDTLATALSAWKPVDYADAALNLGEPVRTVTFTGAGQSHSLKVYGDSKHIEGAYARLDDGGAVLVMSRADIGKVFVAPKNLYQLKVLDLMADDIAQVDVSGPAGAWTLARQEEALKLTVGGATTDAKQDEADAWLNVLAELQVADVLFGLPDMTIPAENVITLKLKDGATHVVAVGPNQNGMHEVKVSGRNSVFSLEHAVATSLTPAPETLKAEPPAAPAPEAAPVAPAPEAAPAAPAPEAAPVVSAPEVAPAAPAPEAAPVVPAPEVAPAAPAPEAAPVAPAPEAAPAAPAPEAAPVAQQ